MPTIIRSPIGAPTSPIPMQRGDQHIPTDGATENDILINILDGDAANGTNTANRSDIGEQADTANKTVQNDDTNGGDQHNVERCQLCSAKNDRWMVCCDKCQKWYHYRCVGVDHSIRDREFICKGCIHPTPAKSCSKRSSNVEFMLARLEEERQLKLRMLDTSKKLQEQRDREYAMKIQEAEEEMLAKKYQMLGQPSCSGSSVDKRSMVENYVHSHGASVLDKNEQERIRELCNSGELHPDNKLMEISKADLLFFENNDQQPVKSAITNEDKPTTSKDQPQQKLLPTSTATRSKHIQRGTSEYQTNHQIFFQPPDVSSFTDPKPKNADPLDSLAYPWYIQSKPTPASVEQMPHEEILTARQLQARALLRKDNLPEFTGAPSEWPVFINAYVRTTKRCGYSNEENLERLLKALKGKARALVQSRLISPHTVPSVVETLRRHYGNPSFIVDDLIKKAQQVPAIKTENGECFVRLATAVEDLVETLENSMIKDELNNRSLIYQLVLKLPFHYQMIWTAYATTTSSVNLSTFSNWLVSIAHTASALPRREYKDSTEKNRNNNRSGNRATHQVAAHDVKTEEKPSTTNTDSANHKSKCPSCGSENHNLPECPSFIDMNKNQRWKLVIEKRLCRMCLLRHHTKNCKNKKKCGVDACQKEHHAMLHNPRSTVPETPAPTNANVAESLNHCLNNHDNNQPVLYRILPVKLYNKNKSIQTFAFMDDGSSTTFLDNDIANFLELEGPRRNLCIKWTSDISRTEHNSKEVSLEVSGLNSKTRRFKLSGVRTVSNLNLPIQTVDEKLTDFIHLRGLPINQFTYGKPTILIGMDNYDLCVPRQIRKGDSSTPIATKTKLGWVLSGPIDSSLTSVHLNFHVCDQNRDDELNALVKSFFTVESLGTEIVKFVESSENIRAKEVMEDTTKLDNDQRFETGLIWKAPNTNLPESKKMAERRFLCLEKKLNQDEELRQNVSLQIKSYVEKNYARKLTEVEAAQNSNITWYLPVFTVRNPNKPSKVRLVWDAAAKSHGISLNDNLLKGPDLLNSLQSVLMRFRERPVAIGGDLVEMFHQVKIIENDQQAQRFLWRESMDEPLETYLMQRMTFGASCSPSSAQFVLRMNANRFADEFPRAVHAICKNHYVDDWLDSFDTTEEALEVVDQVTKIHKAGGFTIHNWMTNDKTILSKFQECGEEQKCFYNPDALERVLGMHWRTNDDKFVFVINRNRIDNEIIDGHKTPTKRQVLSTVMSIFDPLGLIAFYVIFAKIVLQEIWRSGVGWDEPIEDKENQKWMQWTSQFNNIENISIPRCYTYPQNTTQPSYELHIFVDASEAAYAAVAYVCSESENNRKCSLIASKTRVAPLRPISIPRLELLGAVLGTRLAMSISESHTIKFRQRFFWTDSQTVLQWLRSDARKYRQFVGLRLGEILERTDVAEWNWVPTSENVADEATKWATTPKFNENSRWYLGPPFIEKSQDYWPKFKPTSAKTDADDELRTNLNVHAMSVGIEPISPKVENFSTWERLCHATLMTHRLAYRWINRLKSKKTDGSVLDENSFDYKSAELILFRKAQHDEYQNEIQQLTKSGSINKSSKIFGYSPYMDETCILRMRGRLDNADGILFDTKRPIILPYDHKISFLYVDYLHRKYLHRNHDSVLNDVRQRIIIPKLKSLLKKVRFQCQRCRNDAAKPRPPEMGNLPKSRLKLYCTPFSYVGVDYFGPIEVSVGRRTEKRYGSLFTCMTTRSIHIEVAHSLTTDACIMALQRFISRQGIPIEVSSDNGTNFRGASNELHALARDLSDGKVLEHKFPDIKWTFIPPSSPHFGGTWERMVRCVKTNLCELLQYRRQSDEMLLTCLAQVENIINSRPLTDLPIDDENGEALTPNHLIHGTSNGVKPFFNKTLDDGLYKKHWMTVEQITTSFWQRFINEYMPTLTKRTKWFEKAPPLKIGDVVIIVDNKNPKNTWPQGIIVDVIKAADGQTRSAVVKTNTGLYTKPTVKLAVLNLESKASPIKSAPSEILTGEDHVENTADIFGKANWV